MKHWYMIVLLLLVLLLWSVFRDRDFSAVTGPGLKPRTEIHSPLMRQVDAFNSGNTLSYEQAAGEREARSRLERLGCAYEGGLITAEEYHREGSALLSFIAFEGLPGTERGK